MYNGDRARKVNLVENGFRLPAAYDNRPMRFEEFDAKMNQVVCVSATPANYEIGKSCESEMKGRTKPIISKDDENTDTILGLQE